MTHATQVVLIRHAASAPDPETPESGWPLSPRGQDQAERLPTTLAAQRVDAIYSSPFVRAVATVTPLAEVRKLPVLTVPDLREKKLSDGLVADWRDQVERSWSDFSYALPSGETSAACQRRIQSCIDGIAAQHPDGTVVICSHGNALALFLNALDPSFGHAQWQAMPNPALYHAQWRTGAWTWTAQVQPTTQAETT